MPWISAIAAIGGGILSNNSAKKAAKGSQYQPWGVSGTNGQASFINGQLNLSHNAQSFEEQNALKQLGLGALGRYQNAQDNQLNPQFLRDAYNQSMQQSQMGDPNSIYGINQGLAPSWFGNGSAFNQQTMGAQALGSQALGDAFGGYGGQNFLNAGQTLMGVGYQPQDFMTGVNNGMLNGFDPNQAAQSYTNNLRAQALPQEQQAAASMANSLFGSGRLGTTGGANQMGALQQSQAQADIGRQVAGQQYGLQQQLMAQQGYDQARQAQQGLMLNAFGANQQGMQNQYGIAQSLAQTGAGLMGSAYNNAANGLGLGMSMDQYGYDRMMGQNQMQYERALNANNTAWQRGLDMQSVTGDRFNRAMQLFGMENSIGQQALNDYGSFLGFGQSRDQMLMDQARIGASVGQSQSAASANAAQIRNQGNQDMIAGFLSAANQYSKYRQQQNNGSGTKDGP